MRAVRGMSAFSNVVVNTAQRRVGSFVWVTAGFIATTTFAAVLATQRPGAAAFVTITLGGLVALTMLSLRSPFILLPVLAGFAARVAAVVIHEHVVRLPQAADAGGFVLRALALAQLPASELLQQFGTGARSVPWLTAWLFQLTGPEPAAAQAVMVVMGTGLIIATCRLAQALGAAPRMVLIVAWVMAFFPQPIVHSALLLREIPFSLFFTLALTQLVHWDRTRRPWFALSGALYILAAALFHAAAIFAYAAFLVYAGLRSVSVRDSARLVLGIVSFSLVLGLGWTVLEAEFAAEQLGGSYATIGDAYFSRELQPTLGGAAYPEELRIRGPEDLWKAPIRLVLFLFAPLPWMVQTARQSLGVIDSVLFVMAAFLIVRGYAYWKSIGRQKSFRLIAAVVFVGVVVFALAVSNYGTAIRHRAKFTPAVVVLAVAGLGKPSRCSQYTRLSAGENRATVGFVAGGRLIRDDARALRSFEASSNVRLLRPPDGGDLGTR